MQTEGSYPRALLVFGLWLAAPPIILWLLAALGLLIAMGPLLLVLLVVFPHQWFVRREAYQSVAVLTDESALFFALLQWLIVAIIYARLTSHLTPRVHAWLAPVVIVLVGLVITIGVNVAGLTVEADWL